PVLARPSRGQSLGAVLAGAWAGGKPGFGGPAAAARELIDEGVDGWTVPQEPRAIAAALERVLGDEALARRAGAAGRAKVAARFSWPAIAQRHLEIYQALLARAERPA